MLRKILIGVAAVVALLVVLVALQPGTYRVSRSTTIAAPARAVFERVNDLHKFQEWSPWARIDPALKATYSGPASGVGAAYDWVGNSEVGEGRMTIVESKPTEVVRIKLEFIKPFASTATTDFTFAGEGEQTTVTWSMYGEKNFMSKAFGLIMSMDKMIGASFEQGLAQMKLLAESEAGK